MEVDKQKSVNESVWEGMEGNIHPVQSRVMCDKKLPLIKIETTAV